jgi:iron complex outermembrane receptor protein
LPRRFWLLQISSIVAMSLAILAGSAGPLAGQADSTGRDFSTMDLEDLPRVRITTVSRKPEAIGQAAAAITVISREDIRRFGATTLPEALRMVPGFQVARAGTREYAVSTRGFNDITSNKMLVLIDGRAVYSPLFAGVNWAHQRVNLRDIDRIEVIRGPGATLWGSNAVNGVINIITRPTAETQGGEAAVTAGTAERYSVSARYGFKVKPGLTFRVYATGAHESVTETLAGDDIPDGWGIGQAGFRADWSGSSKSSFTMQGDVYRAGGQQVGLKPILSAPFLVPVSGDNTGSGFNILGRYRRRFSDRSEFVVQSYFDHSLSSKPGVYGDIGVSIGDVDLQYRVPLGNRHDILTGLGYRLIHDNIDGAFPIEFNPDARTVSLFTGFVQDDIVLVPNHFAVTLGTKLEHNHYSGFEVQPNVRLLWTPTVTSSVWGAVSRAVRSPSRVDEDVASRFVFDNAGTTTIIEGRGTHNFISEELTAYELGYRATPHQRVSIDLATYYNDYDHLRTIRAATPEVQGPNVVLPFLIENQGKGQTYGGEASVTLQFIPRWRLRFGYAYLHMEVQPRKNAPAGTSLDPVPGLNPEHQASIWSSLDLAKGFDFDLITRYVSPLPGGPNDVPDYVTGDAKLGLTIGDHFRLSLIGRDLFQRRHVEFRFPGYVPELRAIERRVLAAVAWVF